MKAWIARRATAVAGVDEAGLGPTLGPLVLGATLFRGAHRAVKDLFGSLRGVVERDPSALPHRIAIDDSKRLFAGRRTLAPLELAALATLHPGTPLATRLEEVCGADGRGEPVPSTPNPPTAPPTWPPWYRCERFQPALPTVVEPELLVHWRRRWPEELAARGLAPVAAFTRPVLEGELNRSFERGVNKADALLSLVGPILRRLAALAPADDLSITVDRLGGRRYYADFLATVFPLREIATLEETEAFSSYAIRDGERTIAVAFEVEGDGSHLEVALASVCAKYVRELFVRRMNDHFGARMPGLRPTAGYAQDAWRWLEDAAGILSAAERAALIRQR